MDYGGQGGVHWKFPDRHPTWAGLSGCREGGSARHFFPDCLQLQTPLLEGTFGQTGEGNRPGVFFGDFLIQ